MAALVVCRRAYPLQAAARVDRGWVNLAVQAGLVVLAVAVTMDRTAEVPVQEYRGKGTKAEKVITTLALPVAAQAA